MSCLLTELCTRDNASSKSLLVIGVSLISAVLMLRISSGDNPSIRFLNAIKLASRHTLSDPIQKFYCFIVVIIRVRTTVISAPE